MITQVMAVEHKGRETERGVASAKCLWSALCFPSLPSACLARRDKPAVSPAWRQAAQESLSRGAHARHPLKHNQPQSERKKIKHPESEHLNVEE